MTAPKTSDFYDGFEAVSRIILTASRELQTLLTNAADRQARVVRLKTLEHEADQATHQTFERLNRTFITPMAREDIHELAARLDDVVDLIYAAGGRVEIYNPRSIPAYLTDIAALLIEATTTLEKAVRGMRTPKQREQVLQWCVEVNRYENQADEKLREGLKTLFATERDPIELIKLKETLEILEETTDTCEVAANVIQGIVLKHA